MDISKRVHFKSPPAAVRKAIESYVESQYPRAKDYIRWDSSGTRAKASVMGASCSLVLTGEGPTVVELEGRIGFPASLAVSEAKIERYLGQAVRDLKKKTP